MTDFTPKPKADETRPEPRNVLSRLPTFLQNHDDVKKFFKGVANHFFEPAAVEEISGFIGRRSTVFNANDFYIPETTSSRQNYQLEPAVVSLDEEENINAYRFYEDLVDNLRVQGSLTNNHSRLFESEFWTWCPPINPDMLINFSNYYWLEEGPPVIEVTGNTNIVLDMIGQENFQLPDGTDVQSGMRVVFRDDDNTEYNDINFLIVNVGRSIRLLDDSEFDNAISGTAQDYIVMERGAQDQNAWSTRNRWFHRNQISNVDLTNYIAVQARRPIIQFEADIQLRNMGRTARDPVNVLLTGPLNSVQGQETASIDGVLIEDGMRILVTGEPTEGQNNLVYLVTGHEETGVYVLVKEIDGQAIDGSPVEGEVLRVTQGVINTDRRYYWDGSAWVEGQRKTTENQYPLFDLFDIEATRLDDSTTYPNSTFNGSFLFGFEESDENPIDSLLGLRITFNSFGEINYNNFIQSDSFTYEPDTVTTAEIPGMRFFRKNGFTSSFDSYESDWRHPTWLSRQSVSDSWIIKQKETSSGAIEFPLEFTLSQTPEDEVPGQFQTFRLFLNGNLLESGIDFARTGNMIELSETLTLENNDFLEARSFDRDRSEPLDNGGYYRIPTNLQANPNNENIETISYNELFEHFITIIENQQGITGRPYGVNNFNSTARNLAAGTEILQHSGPLLRLMFLNQNKEINFRNAIRFVSLEYQKWFAKFESISRTWINEGRLADYASADLFIDAVVAAINIGKDDSFPFLNSGMLGDDLYVPPTPAFLGFGIVFTPTTFVDDTLGDRSVTWRRGHDGSLAQVTGGDFDDIMLRLEERVYDSIQDKFKMVHPEFSHFDVMPGKYRSSAYSRTEWDKIMRPFFENWAFQNGVDHKPNTYYDPTDPFTFNYGGSPDRYGEIGPGHWRGIYRYYFDTDRPHTHPWEMLGFGEEPIWWVTEYGSAPYTRENTEMWQDLEAGVIAGGPRAGVDTRFTRPGLTSVIPVDAAGDLLDPIAAGIIPSAPPAKFASSNFKFGDVSPVEWLWRISNLYPFDLAGTTYLARPAEWLEKTWDAIGTERFFRTQQQSQVVYAPIRRRAGVSEDSVHSQTNREIGSQQWFSDFWLSKGFNQENLNSLLQDLTVQLGYRTGSFINTDGLRITSDNFGLVPAEDITTVLNQSASRREPVYSALIVRWDGTSYRVRGYDPLYPTIRYFRPSAGNKSTFSFGKLSSTLYSNFDNTEHEYEYDDPIGTIQDVTNLITGYGAWLESEGWVFDEFISSSNEMNNWNRMAKEFVKWADGDLSEDAVLFLSPFSSQAAFQADFGLVDKITQYTNGSWTALDYEGIPMRTDSFDVSRIDNQVSITHTNTESLALLRLTLIEYDHALLFNNTTQFDNLIYEPKINLRQRRFRLIGTRTKFWNGRFDAPGYLIQSDTIIPNYDTRAENIRKFYDPYAIGASSAAFDHARHLVGYQKRRHMQEMLLDDRSQFNFFRGFLQEKGTKASFDRLLRSTFIRNSQEDFQIFEEWAVLVGEYGAREIRTALEFALLQSEIKTDPQTITFSTNPNAVDSKLDQIITIPLNDDRWIRTADSNFSNKFTLRNFENILGKDLPTAGWARLGETDYLVAGEDGFETLWEDQNKLITEGQDVWVVKDDKGDWDIRRFSRLGKINEIIPGDEETDSVTIRTYAAHGLSVGDIVIFPDSTESTPDYIDSQTVSAVIDDFNFQISTPATVGATWITTAASSIDSPTTNYGDNLIVNGVNVLFVTSDQNEFSTVASPENLNLGGLTLTVDGDTVTFIGNIVTGLTTNPKIRSSDISTSLTLDDYPINFYHTNVVGSVINPTVVVDGTNGIYINGTDVIWTGAGNLDSIVANINAANISRIFADKTGTGNTQLRLWNLGDQDITLRSIGTTEDPLEQLGLAANTALTGTNMSPVVTVDTFNGININGTAVVFTGAGDAAAIVNDITTAAIADITAAVVGGAVQIIHGTGGDIYVYNIDATEDAIEILGFDIVTAGKTTADYVSDINAAVDIAVIEASVSSGKIQLEKKDGGSISMTNGTGTPSIDFGFQSSYAARTLTQIVAEMVAVGQQATEASDSTISFAYPSTSIIAVSGTAAAVLGLEAEYKAMVSYADVVSQISVGVFPDIEFSDEDGILTFKALNGGSITFAGTSATELGFASSYTGPGAGPDFYGWNSMRRPAVSAVGSSVPIDGWVLGDKIFVDPDLESNLGLPVTAVGRKLWSVYSYNGTTWDLVRYQLDRIDTPIIESVFLFDALTNDTINQVSTWDPIKKVIPGIATSELFYTLEIDPAVYTNGDETGVVQNTDNAWGIEQTGRLWWDLNAVRYLDYEQGDLSYRRKYWGRKLTGSSIDIYEWTRSPVPPSGWDEYVVEQASNASSDYLPSGTVKNASNPAWVESVEFDKTSQQNRTFYYFWVLNPRFRPNKPFRSRSAFEVSAIIDSPQKAGILYFSPIDVVSSDGFDESSFLIGNATNIITNDDVIVQLNFRKRPEDDENVHKEWALVREGSDDTITPSIWSKLRQSLIGEDATGLSLPDINLNESRRYGVKIRPRQSMFKDRENARRTFINAANRLLLQENIVDNDPDWESTFLAKDPEPTDFDFQVNSRVERDLLTTNPLFDPGMTVLILEDEQDKNKWTHWSWDGNTFTLLDKEEYDMQNFWSYEDWYDPDLETLGGADSGEGVSREVPPTTIFATIADRDASHPNSVIEAHNAAHPQGHIVLVLDNGEGRWVWSQYQDDGVRVFWNTVAIQDGTIQLNDAVYSFDLADSDLELENKIAVGKLVDYFDE